MPLFTRFQTKWRKLITIVPLIAIVALGGNAGSVFAANLNFGENFETFNGSGFAPIPAAGQLDSDDWRVTGLSFAEGTFGGTHTTDDFARGPSTGGETSGGVYAFNTGGNVIFGLQPAGSDVTPGAITLLINNNTGSTVTTLDISYEIWYLNDADRANSLNFAHSANDTTYTGVPALNFTTPELLDALGWQMVTRNTQLTGLSIPNGGVYYLQWPTDDVSGAGSRDEIGIDDVSVSVGPPVDVPPTVSSTTPANGATGVATNANIDITFSEPVTVQAGWFGIDCTVSNNHNAVQTGGTTTYTLDPDNDFVAGEVCTVDVIASAVADQDAPIDPMAANYQFSFTVAGVPVTCGTAATLISDVQGGGSATPIPGSTVTVEAIVTGDYQEATSTQLNGFFLQEEDSDADANPTTSEGVFVFEGSLTDDVAVGDLVRVTGSVSEFFNSTQINATSIEICTNGNPQPTAATIDLPVVAPVINDYYEPMESMRVVYIDQLFVSEYFEMARFGQVILYEAGRPFQYTHNDNSPTPAEYAAHLDDLARRRVILDDDDNRQNAPLGFSEFIFHPMPGGLSIGTQGVNFFRGGDAVTSLTGILHWSFNGLSGTDAWRIRPVPITPPTFTPMNTRPATPPALTGNIRVASYNVLNYFDEPDLTSSSSSGSCGATGTMDCRGADSAAELVRQTDKLNTALAAINADVFGLMELENDGTTVDVIVNNLNSFLGSSTYAAINPGIVGTDAITVGIIYKPAVVQPLGAPAILDDPAFTDPNNTGTPRSRPAIAQTFQVIAVGHPDEGEVFTVVVNHLKSKGSSGCTGLDCDQGDGQAAWNDTRTKAAAYLVNTWIPSDPTGQGDPDFLLVGDLNAYAGEDPIDTIIDAGYTNLVEAFGGATAYSYLFDGQLGYLDHALANPSMAAQVTGVADWHINADEIPLFDYNDDVKDIGEATFEREPSANPLYEVNPYRTSDHDPVIIMLDLASPLPDLTVSKSSNVGEFTTSKVWTWSLAVSNIGTGNASFANGAVILSDALPAGITYTNPRITGSAGVTGTISCAVVANTLTCTAVGPVSAAASGSFTAAVDATAPGSGTWTNPAGVCAVDPNNVLIESEESNNACNASTVNVGVGMTLGSGSASCAPRSSWALLKLANMVNGRNYTLTLEAHDVPNSLVYEIRQFTIPYGGTTGAVVNFKAVMYPFYDNLALVPSGWSTASSWTVLPSPVTVILTLVDQVTSTCTQTTFNYFCATGATSFTSQTVTNSCGANYGP